MRRLAVRMHIPSCLALTAVLVPTVTSGAEAAPLAARDRPCRPIEQVVATDLGDLGGDGGTTATDLDDRGRVVGVADTPVDEGHAFVWRQGVMTDLTPSVRGYSIALATNNRGQVLLRWTEADTFREGTILWSRRGEIAIDTHDPRDLNERGQVLLPALSSLWDRGDLVPIPATIDDGEPLRVAATGLGDGGHVIGTLWPVPGPGGGHPPQVGGFVWHDGTLTRLDIAPYALGEPVDVDRRGRVLLNAVDPAGRSAALLWEDGEYVDLGSLGGPSASSRAVDINDRGQVVGSSTTADGDTHAFLWQRGEMVDLDGVAGRESHATAVSARGHVAGYALSGELPFQQSTGFLWWCGEMLELPLSVIANGVNARGQVIGQIRAPTSAPHAGLWTPATPRSQP